uniref:Amino acid transporter transmembrane domain-containing protein n=1 Tax=Megaselia scalaris TaxID=36166 RepID=T1GNW0_MEGSC
MLSSDNGDNNGLCWEGYPFTRLTVYRMCLVGFVLIMGPFALFNVSKTKYIQMITILCRWAAFGIMIVLALIRLITINDPAELGHPKAFNFGGLPKLFGACVYSFMCHHSLPSLIAPIANKQKIKFLMSMDYLLICLFYIFLAITGAFAFAHIEELYTLNFIPQSSDSSIGKFMEVIDYFLALFPVFTLSASYPVIAITLRNNLQTMFLDMSRIESYNFFLRRLLFPLLAVIPPLINTYFTDSLTDLVGFTGSYAGTGIQYLIPIFLVYFARKTCGDLLGQGIVNKYRSPFSSNWWLIGVFLWSIGCVTLVTINSLKNETDEPRKKILKKSSNLFYEDFSLFFFVYLE